MFDLIPFTNKYRSLSYDPFREFFGNMTVNAATDIQETDKAFVIETELPGYDKADIHVTVKDGVLTISAEHKTEKEEKNDKNGYIRRERSWGSCQRSFDVDGIDTSAIGAEYVNGVLKLTLPKLTETKPEQYEIEVR
jgi:HSP20 family protein